MQPCDPAGQVEDRTPTVFVFNPFAEGHIARGKMFTPVKHQEMLAGDLANLPQFLCRSEDIVLLPKRPSNEFSGGINQAGFALPEFVELKGGRIDPASSLFQRNIRGLRPWAWGPDSFELLAPLFAQVTGEARAPSERFNDSIARLYSKSWSADFLRSVLAHRCQADTERWLCTQNEVGVAVDTLDAALDVVAAIRARGHHRVVAKESHGLAGQNAIRLWEPELLDSQRRWMARALEGGRQLVIEPWLERELDFSVQLEMGPANLKLSGYTGLINDRKGQFQANCAASNSQCIPANVTALFQPADVSGCLQRLYSDILSLLEAELRRADYVGPIGIDAFVYRTREGGCRLKPVVEINPRYTMGRLTLELMKRVSSGSNGLFRLVSRAQAKAEGFADFNLYARAITERFPLCFEDGPARGIREGAFCLNDPARAQVCIATFHVSPRMNPPATIA